MRRRGGVDRAAGFVVLFLCVMTGAAAAAPIENGRAAQPEPTASEPIALPQPRPASLGKPAPLTADQATMCQTIEAAAAKSGLPAEFLARLLWQESSFDPDAVSWAGAQGVAQFMPPTATERGLGDPFDPARAIPASAAFLADLRGDFGNLGLAAAAYNAGSGRLRRWLAGTGVLPWETQAYVQAITGYTVDQWAAAKSQPTIAGKPKSALFPLDCKRVVAKLRLPGGRRVVHPRPIAPWGVQVAGNFSRAAALAAFARARKRYASVLAGIDPMVMSRRRRSRGRRPLVEVRLPAQTRSAADKLCGRLRRAGGACIVLRN
jgi:hypothetical protein